MLIARRLNIFMLLVSRWVSLTGSVFNGSDCHEGVEMDEKLPEELEGFLNALADAMGWHRLEEFLSGLRANPGWLDDPDPAEEVQDVISEMKRLAQGEAFARLLRLLQKFADLAERHSSERH